MIHADNLSRLKNISHGFFTRAGGVSTGIYAGRNCGLGSDDLRTHVVENRGRVADDMGIDRKNLLTVHQVHSPRVVSVSGIWEPGEAPEADAMVTNIPGIGLGILTADCAPVLFADETAGVVAAAHAGWKGALSGVLEATVETMISHGADREAVTCAIGPCISQSSYEVGPEFADGFMGKDARYAAYFIPSAREGHFHFDLSAFVADRLAALGMKQVETLGLCTYADEPRFFSFRRTTHAGEPDYGRQMSAIALT